MGNTAVFVGINAIVEPAHKAAVISGLFLSTAIGMITGIAATSAMMLEVMQKSLNEKLVNMGLGPAERLEVSLSRRVLFTKHLIGRQTDYIQGRGKR